MKFRNQADIETVLFFRWLSVRSHACETTITTTAPNRVAENGSTGICNEGYPHKNEVDLQWSSPEHTTFHTPLSGREPSRNNQRIRSITLPIIVMPVNIDDDYRASWFWHEYPFRLQGLMDPFLAWRLLAMCLCRSKPGASD